MRQRYCFFPVCPIPACASPEIENGRMYSDREGNPTASEAGGKGSSLLRRYDPSRQAGPIRECRTSGIRSNGGTGRRKGGGGESAARSFRTYRGPGPGFYRWGCAASAVSLRRRRGKLALVCETFLIEPLFSCTRKCTGT